MNLAGKVVVVTGASRGIGRALCFELARAGCRLELTALEEEELAALAAELHDSGASVAVRPADLTDAAARRDFLDWIRSRDPPDILVNNAGAGRFARFDRSDPGDIERALLLNIHVPVLLTRELLPVLASRPQAKIVNISSAVSRLPYPGLAVYGAAKGFMSSFCESLACELGGSRISVLCFHPGFTGTHFMTTAGMDMSRIPAALIGTPAAVAARIRRAMERDVTWSYSDLLTSLGVSIARLLPHRLRVRWFRNLFWKLPDHEHPP